MTTSTSKRRVCGHELVQEWIKAAQGEGGADPYTGKRSDLRIEWTPAIRIYLPSPAARPEVIAVARNISEKGMRLNCRQELPLYSNVQLGLDGASQVVPARIMHCTMTVGSFVIGVEFTFST